MTLPRHEWVWMTTQAHGTPHAAALQAANPGLPIHLSAPPVGSTPEAYHHAWRNCDRNIRRWWQQNRHSVQAHEIIFGEYDVFCNVNTHSAIPPLPAGVGIAGPRIMSSVRDLRTYWPFQDIARLPRTMHALATALAPLALLLISRPALDAIIAPEWDALFAADIFSELRLPTLIRHCGFQVAALQLPDVHCTPKTPGPTACGIFHPVKNPVS